MKPAWAYYTDKMWSFFLPRRQHHDQRGTEKTDFRSDVDRLNWDTCQRVWDGLTKQEQEVLLLVYCTEYHLTPGAVVRYANSHGMDQHDVMRIAARCGKKLAVERGLAANNIEKGGSRIDNQKNNC